MPSMTIVFVIITFVEVDLNFILWQQMKHMQSPQWLIGWEIFYFTSEFYLLLKHSVRIKPRKVFIWGGTNYHFLKIILKISPSMNPWEKPRGCYQVLKTIPQMNGLTVPPIKRWAFSKLGPTVTISLRHHSRSQHSQSHSLNERSIGAGVA